MLYKQAICLSTSVLEDQELNTVASLSSMHVGIPQKDCIYLRTIAIGNMCVDGANANHDGFPYSEFICEKPGYGFKSFVGKKAFIEHDSSSVVNAVGDLLDSYLRKFDFGNLSSKAWNDLNDQERLQVVGEHLKKDAGGNEILKAYGVKDSILSQKDGSIEVLMKLDRKRCPSIARQIDLGEKIGVSMGTAIAYSECSICGNRAYFEKDYCTHIKNGKGRHHSVLGSELNDLIKKGTLKPEWLRFLVASPVEIKTIFNNEKRSVYAKAQEINYGLSFYELSVVGNPAYNKGYAIEKVANKDKSWLEIMPEEEFIELYKTYYN